MKVLHCPTDTGGNAWGLSRAERALGIQSDVMVRSSSGPGYPNDVDLRLREGLLPARISRLVKFSVHAIREYDVFHFNWGMSVVDYWHWDFNYLELPLLKKLGKRIIMTFQGCDARMKMLSRERLSTSACAECDVAWCTERMDRIRLKRIKKAFAYADKVFALNPDLLHFLPGAEFLPYASVNPAEWISMDGGRAHSSHAPPIRILHLPTNRSIKGTRYVEKACTQLQREGVAVELMVVEGVPHSRIRERIMEADLVVDQLLIGWYGALAVEAMALGKPVLCYLRDDDIKRFVPFHGQIPIIRTTKETLADDLRSLVRIPERWNEIGRAGRHFVQTYHDPFRIAERTIRAYQHVCAA